MMDRATVLQATRHTVILEAPTVLLELVVFRTFVINLVPSPGADLGSWGSGRAGMQARAGISKQFIIHITGERNDVARYPWRYDLEVTKIRYAPQKGDGIVEPGCLVDLYPQHRNSGECPTPTYQDILAYLAPTQWVLGGIKKIPPKFEISGCQFPVIPDGSPCGHRWRKRPPRCWRVLRKVRSLRYGQCTPLSPGQLWRNGTARWKRREGRRRRPWPISTLYFHDSYCSRYHENVRLLCVTQWSNKTNAPL